MNQTKSTKLSDITRSWHLVNVKGEVLGRIATKIANLLMGKGKAYFVRNMDVGDYVIVVNTNDIVTTGKKAEKKKYYRHSGYPGGLKVETLQDLKQRKPEEVIRHAVKGMLPQNRLRDRMLKRLYVFMQEEHPYGDKIKDQKANIKDTH